MPSLLGYQRWVFVDFLLRKISVERCLGPNLISVMILRKGSSKADYNKEVKLGRGREASTKALTRGGDDSA